MVGVPNVLMGIMGAAVTMGLALAGGSQIGPQFRQVDEVTRAAMVITAVRQTGQAAVMASTLDGGVKQGIEGTRALVSSGWLSSTPTNPTSDQPAGAPVVRLGEDGTRFVAMPLVADDGRLCAAVAKQSGDTPVVDRLDASAPVSGCARIGGSPTAFVRI